MEDKDEKNSDVIFTLEVSKNRLEISSSKYKLEKTGKGSQGSYNLSVKGSKDQFTKILDKYFHELSKDEKIKNFKISEEDLKKLEKLKKDRDQKVDKRTIKVEQILESNIYISKDDVKIELGHGVLAILESVGFKMDDIENIGIVLTKAYSNGKYQLIVTHNEKFDNCKWFRDFYDYNVLNASCQIQLIEKDNTRIIRFENYFNYQNSGDIKSSKNNDLRGFNKIFYGIPGCGKSYKVSAMLGYKEGFEEEAEKYGITSAVDPEFIFRTTFFLDYMNSDFVGQIYPVVDGNKVEYKPVPGPFTKALVKALLNPDQMVYLVIEELNRGNAAAIFGDLFQLLDRVKEECNGYIGESEYPISNEFIEGYIREWNKNNKVKIPFEEGKVYIPNNLSIFATMNTSDQNVFPLDTAFKRRWSRERIIPNWDAVSFRDKFIPFTRITWREFATKVNAKMNSCTDGTVSSDKNLGPYFISSSNLSENANEGNVDQSLDFMNNVIDYLYNDVTKFNHDLLFSEDYSYDEIYEYFDNGIEIDKGAKFKEIFTVDFEELGESNEAHEQ